MRVAYGGDHERLVVGETTHDPDNLFPINLNSKPAEAAPRRGAGAHYATGADDYSDYQKRLIWEH